MIKTFNISTTGYGPYLDGRIVFDALHHNQETGEWFEEVGHQQGSPARLQYPCAIERVQHLSRCMGGKGIADYLQEISNIRTIEEARKVYAIVRRYA